MNRKNNDTDQQLNSFEPKPIVDSPNDIAMDCSDSATVQSIVDPQAIFADVASPTYSVQPEECIANVVPPTEEAMEYHESSDPLLSAMCKLETIASQNGFTIHVVPADGDCMFSAIDY